MSVKTETTRRCDVCGEPCHVYHVLACGFEDSKLHDWDICDDCKGSVDDVLYFLTLSVGAPFNFRWKGEFQEDIYIGKPCDNLKGEQVQCS